MRRFMPESVRNLSIVPRAAMKRLALGVSLACLALTFSPAAQAVELPDDLVRLLPGQPDLLVAASSLQEMDKKWIELTGYIAEINDEGDEPMPTLDEMLQEFGPYYEVLDKKRPLAFAMTIPNMMMGQQPAMSIVIPVTESDVDLSGLSIQMDMPTVVQENGYVLLSQVLEYVPAAEPSHLISHLTGEALSACADVKNLWANYGPMLDFGLMAMNQPQPPAEGETEPGEPEMTAEQTAAMGEMIRNFFQSADVLAMGVDLKDGQVIFTEKLATLAGTPLAPLAQPDFQEALELSKFLDNDAQWVAAYSIELGSILDMYKGFYGAMLEEELGAVDGGSGLDMDAFIDAYFQMIDMAMQPTAMVMDFSDGKFNTQYVLKSDDVDAMMAHQENIIQQINDGFPWLNMTPVKTKKIEGLDVRTWDYEWDMEALAELAADGMEEDQSGADLEEMRAMIEIMDDLMPRASMATKDDLVFASMGLDDKPLQEMIKKAKKGKGKVNGDLAKMSRKAGPSCQAAFKGDLAPVLILVFEIAEELSEEDLPALDLDPIPLTYVMNIDENSYSINYHFGLSGMTKLVAAIEQFEELDGDSDGQE